MYILISAGLSDRNTFYCGRSAARTRLEQRATATIRSTSNHVELVSGLDTQMPALHVVWAKQPDNLYSYYSGFNFTQH